MAYAYRTANLKGHKDLARTVRELEAKIQRQQAVIENQQHQIKEARRRTRMMAASRATSTPHEYQAELDRARELFPEPEELKNKRLAVATREVFAAGRKRPGCGTYSAYMAHVRRGEPTCLDCRAAMTAYRRGLRARNAAALKHAA